MIELELFQHEPTCGMHHLKIWINGHIVFIHDLCTQEQVIELRDALHNELLWLNHHIQLKGLENEQTDKGNPQKP